MAAEGNIVIRLSNGKEAGKTLKELRQSANRLRREIQDLDPASEEFIEKSQDLQKVKGRYNEINDEVHGVNSAMKDSRELIDEFVGSIKKGEAPIAAFKTLIGGLVQSAKALLLNPFAAVFAGLAVVFKATKAWYDYNKELTETTRLTSQLTGLTGDAMRALRSDVQATADTFGLEFDETLRATTNLAKHFGITYDEALKLVQEGVLRGANANGEFMSIMAEYPAQLKNAGATAEEFIKIVTQEQTGGIFADKLSDSIKELNLRITEQTPAAKEALENAFGKQFTDKLFKNLRSGSMTTIDALKEISAETKKVGLNSQQTQQLTADLFGGAGEDAGGFLAVIENVNIALVENQAELTKAQKAQQRQLETTKELERTWAALFDQTGGGFETLIADAKHFGAAVLLDLVRGVVGLINTFIDLYNNSMMIRVAFQMAVFQIRTFVDIGAAGFKLLWNVIKSVGDLIVGIFTLDINRIRNGLSSGIEEAKKIYTEAAKDIGENFTEGLVNTIQEGKIPKIELDLEKTNTTENKTNTTNTTSEAIAGIKEQKEAQKAILKLRQDAREQDLQNQMMALKLATSKEIAHLKGSAKEVEAAKERLLRAEAEKMEQLEAELLSAQRDREKATVIEQTQKAIEELKGTEEQIKQQKELLRHKQRHALQQIDNNYDLIELEKQAEREEEIRQAEERIIELKEDARQRNFNNQIRAIKENTQLEIKSLVGTEEFIANEKARLIREQADRIAEVRAQIREEKKERELEQLEEDTNLAIEQLVGTEEQIREQKKLLKEQELAEIAAIEHKYRLATEKEEKKKRDRELAHEKKLKEDKLALKKEIVDAATASTQMIIDLFGEESKAAKAAQFLQKALAISEIRQSVEKQIASAKATGAKIGGLAPPFTTPIGIAYTIAATASAIAGGAASIRNIKKAEKGMLVKGRRHAEGGIPGVIRSTGEPLEFEDGEIILNRKVGLSPLGRRMASDLNAAYGGKRFELGGIVSTSAAGIGTTLSARPGISSASTPARSAIDLEATNEKLDTMVSAFLEYRQEVSSWQRNLKVINNLQETNEGLNTINEIDSESAI